MIVCYAVELNTDDSAKTENVLPSRLSEEAVAQVSTPVISVQRVPGDGLCPLIPVLAHAISIKVAPQTPSHLLC